ncbi:hypothetical protein GWI33_010275, partial [Rhynchophorus ferrugineus]
MDVPREELKQIRVERPLYEHQELRDNFLYEKPIKI